MLATYDWYKGYFIKYEKVNGRYACYIWSGNRLISEGDLVADSVFSAYDLAVDFIDEMDYTLVANI